MKKRFARDLTLIFLCLMQGVWNWKAYEKNFFYWNKMCHHPLKFYLITSHQVEWIINSNTFAVPKNNMLCNTQFNFCCWAQKKLEIVNDKKISSLDNIKFFHAVLLINNKETNCLQFLLLTLVFMRFTKDKL